ncbi:MAG: hypothetical protein AB8H79_04190 [Myxococcota bacterium]
MTDAQRAIAVPIIAGLMSLVLGIALVTWLRPSATPIEPDPQCQGELEQESQAAGVLKSRIEEGKSALKRLNEAE